MLWNNSRIETKIDKIDDRLDRVDTHLAVYNEQLKQHIEGVEELKRRVSPLEAAHIMRLKLDEEKEKEAKKQANRVNLLGAFLTIPPGLYGAYQAIIQLLQL